MNPTKKQKNLKVDCPILFSKIKKIDIITRLLFLNNNLKNF